MGTTIEPIDKTFRGQIKGILNLIEWERMKIICGHFGVTVQENNFSYCMSIKCTYDGFLINLYKIDSLRDPESLAYDLTANALRLFKNNKLPPMAIDKEASHD